jgi:hypothetical protein
MEPRRRCALLRQGLRQLAVPGRPCVRLLLPVDPERQALAPAALLAPLAPVVQSLRALEALPALLVPAFLVLHPALLRAPELLLALRHLVLA